MVYQNSVTAWWLIGPTGDVLSKLSAEQCLDLLGQEGVVEGGMIPKLESAADANGRLRPFSGRTDIFMTPGYAFRCVDALLTNFHLPRSTLFMLVSALSGLKTMQAAYAHAVQSGYRFYSYGDACLLTRVGPANSSETLL